MNIHPFDLLKNAQKLQEQMGVLQEKLGTIRVTGSAGGGMVEVDLNGRMETLAVRIAAEAMEDREMLQDLAAAAFTSGMDKVRQAINAEMGFLAGMPGLSGFPGL
jgi:DNA-binding YbaB/EbfC family protein